MNKIIARNICFITVALLLTVPIKGFAKSIPDIASENNAAVVLVIAFDKNQKPLGSGSGFFVESNGVLATNFHVIKDASSMWVRISNGGLFPVKDILAIDKQGDIAVLKVQGRRLPTVTLGNSNNVKVGEAVIAIGHPLTLTISLEMEIETTTTQGIVSAIRTVKQSGRQLLQISAPISPGSSGGVLLNLEGEAVGMTTSTLVGGQNINFAIPVNQIKDVIFGRRERIQLAESAKLFYLKGVLAADKMDLEAAEYFYKKALEKDPAHVDAHIGLGSIYYTRNLYDLQLKHFKAAARIDPDNVYAHYYLATAYEDKGLFDRAIAEYQAVLRIDPEDKDALYSLGVLYLVQGRRVEALRAVTSLQKVNPGLGLKLWKLLDAMER